MGRDAVVDSSANTLQADERLGGTEGEEDGEGLRNTTTRRRWFEQEACLQLQRKGAKVGCLVHRSLLCENCGKDLDSAGTKLLGSLREKAVGEPWNPLFFRGVPLMPRIGRPPPYVEERFLGGTDDCVAHGRAYTDGACKGVFRRTRRAGWGFIVGCSALGGQWSMYGTCPDAYASALRSELWAIVALLQRAIPPLCIYTDNAEVVWGFNCGALYTCRAGRLGADLWRRIWHLAGDMGGAQQGTLCESELGVKKVKGHLKEADVEAGKISFEDWAGNSKADALANMGAYTAIRLASNKEADEAWRLADDYYRWSLLRAKQWPSDTGQEEQRGKLERNQPARREPGPLGHALHGKWPHELWVLGDGEIVCRRCGRSTKGLADPKGFTRARCGGSAAGRAKKAGLGGEGLERKEQLYEAEGQQHFALSEASLVARGGSVSSASVGQRAGRHTPATVVLGKVREARKRKSTANDEGAALQNIVVTEGCSDLAGGGKAYPDEDEGGCNQALDGGVDQETPHGAPRSHVDPPGRDLSRKMLLRSLNAKAKDSGETAGNTQPVCEYQSGSSHDENWHPSVLLQKVLEARGQKRGRPTPSVERERRIQKTRESQMQDSHTRDALMRLVEGSDVFPSTTQKQEAPPKCAGKRRHRTEAHAQALHQAAKPLVHVAESEAATSEREQKGGQETRTSIEKGDADSRSRSPPLRLNTVEAPRQPSPHGMVSKSGGECNPLGHRLLVTGSVAWCSRCAGYTENRVGSRLTQRCNPVVAGEGGARATRLHRLRAGRHPLSGQPLA